jgi:pSer/pThr/pTyr-binding forkhead associated (FHA) protein
MILCLNCGSQNRSGSRYCTQCGSTLSDSEDSSAILVVVRDPQKGATFPLQEAATTVGRSSSNDIVFDDPLVSSRHAQISYEDGRFWIEDLKSTNGTMVNGEKITDKIALKDGYLIKIGGIIVKFSTLFH